MTGDDLPGTSAVCSVPTSRRDSVLCRQGSGSETKISPFTADHDTLAVAWRFTGGEANTFFSMHSQECNGPCWGFSRQSRRERRTGFRTTRWGASFHTRFLQTTQLCNSEAGSPASQRRPADGNKQRRSHHRASTQTLSTHWSSDLLGVLI